MTSSTTRPPARELTEWYPADVKPVHVGVYETYLNFSTGGYSYWNGDYWSSQFITPKNAEERGEYLGAQEKTWRGLRSPA